MQSCNARLLLACRTTVELDARMGPQCPLERHMQLVDPLRGGDDIRVVEIRKDGFPVPQLPLHLFRGVERASTGEHQRVSLFSAILRPPLARCCGKPLAHQSMCTNLMTTWFKPCRLLWASHLHVDGVAFHLRNAAVVSECIDCHRLVYTSTNHI